VDVRVVATTNRKLSEMVSEGKFRADLYYRLNVIPLSLPPLRERREDVRELAEHFLRLYAPPGRTLRMSAEFVERLEAHDWPGNVRELANCLRRAVALAAGPEIGREALEGSAWAEAETAGRIKLTSDDVLRAGVSLENMERKLVEMTLAATGGNRSRAAELLGVSLRTVRNKVRDYGLPSWSSYTVAAVEPGEPDVSRQLRLWRNCDPDHSLRSRSQFALRSELPGEFGNEQRYPGQPLLSANQSSGLASIFFCRRRRLPEHSGPD
jgi:hypothetical protein